MADEVLGMAPSAPSVPTLRTGTTYLGNLCCGEARWTNFAGNIITVCPKHGPMMNFEPLRVGAPNGDSCANGAYDQTKDPTDEDEGGT